ncbi:MAG: methylated-DNA--[protein]-cysteine S-methyltransferase [Planctomycetota bacterium]
MPTHTANETAGALIDSPLGTLIARAFASGVTHLSFASDGTAEPLPSGTSRAALDHLDRLSDELAQYFDGALKRFTVDLDLSGTPFQRSVWSQLLNVPYGATTTYATLARNLERPNSARAVGRANGDNPIAIVVPCHRVIGADGTLTGYAGGLWRKKTLLELEGA